MRDYAAELRALIDAETAQGAYISRVVATDIVEKLRANDPELLAGWLDANVETFIWQLINDRDRSLRAHVRATAGRSVFAQDAAEHADGNAGALAHWLTVPFAVADGSRKRLADMTSEDLRYAAEQYDDRARQNAMTAAFLRAIAHKAKKGTVAQHFSDDQLAAMWTSIAADR